MQQHFNYTANKKHFKDLLTLKGKVHDARVQCIHLCVCVTMHAVEIIRRLAAVLGEWTVG